MDKKFSFFKRNGLLLVFLALMILALVGQALTGWNENNQERQEKNLPPLAFAQYLQSGHFIQATFENWESEFLQMGLYVFLTAFLYQQGSAESKSLDNPEEVDQPPVAKKDSPWPVKKGGIILKIYSNSLSIAFTLCFAFSFLAHAYGTMKDINESDQKSITIWQTMAESRF